MSIEKRIGMELEFSARGDYGYSNPKAVTERLQRYLERYRVRPNVQTSWPPNNQWYIKDEHCGVELVSPILHYTDMDMVRKILRAVRSLRPHISPRNMGLHIHIDRAASIYKRAGATLWWYAFEPLLFRLVDSGRQANDWCRRITPYLSDFEDPDNFVYAMWDRNAFCFSDGYPTYEIRLHEATTRYQDVRSWVALLIALIQEGEYMGEMDYEKAAHAAKTIHRSNLDNNRSMLPELRRILHRQLSISTAEMVWRNVLNRLER